MSELELEHRTNIKFLVKLGKSGKEIREMLEQVYGDNAMEKTAVYRWVKCFSEGRESVTDDERSGRPATSRTEENIAKIRHDTPIPLGVIPFVRVTLDCIQFIMSEFDNSSVVLERSF